MTDLQNIWRTLAGIEQPPQASVLLAEQEPMTASSNRGGIYSKPDAEMSVSEANQDLIEDQIYSAGCLE